HPSPTATALPTAYKIKKKKCDVGHVFALAKRSLCGSMATRVISNIVTRPTPPSQQSTASAMDGGRSFLPICESIEYFCAVYPQSQPSRPRKHSLWRFPAGRARLQARLEETTRRLDRARREPSER